MLKSVENFLKILTSGTLSAHVTIKRIVLGYTQSLYISLISVPRPVRWVFSNPCTLEPINVFDAEQTWLSHMCKNRQKISFFLWIEINTQNMNFLTVSFDFLFHKTHTLLVWFTSPDLLVSHFSLISTVSSSITSISGI